ncbi:MAG: patatin-like phospholipase family protein [Thermodesulfobacteriota bacterium]
MDYIFRNLVFEGGGVKGIAYVGAMKILAEKGILSQIERVGGTSAGAINALLLGLNYSLTETEEILGDLDFNNFMDDTWGLIRDSKRLIEEFGWYQGNFFRDWIGELIRRKTGNSEATFAEVNRQKSENGFKDLYFIGTNLSTGFAEVFSYEHTPRKCLADAVRISMSIPLFFAACTSDRGDVYVDGGVMDNYPIKLFDRKKYVPTAFFKEPSYYRDHNIALEKANKDLSPYVYNMETLGFRLDSAKEIAVFRDQAEPPRYEIDDFFTYAWRLVETILNLQNSAHLHSDDWQRTVYIDTLGVKTTQFDLDDHLKDALKKSGEDCATAYFRWYDDPANHPANRP